MFRKSAVTLLAALFATTVAGAAMAQTEFQKDHPRRAEVNHRLENQDKRINHEVKKGEITHKQAAAMHGNDRHVRTEERRMASRNGGHITKAEQHKLNRQENHESKVIGK